jgi:nucleotide-binding universal stress UspA family protein
MMTPNTHPPMNIHLAVDGSEHALAAARLIGDLPLPPGSVITALGVLTARQNPRRSLLLKALDEVEEALQESGAEVRLGILHGNPAEALTHFADEHQPDLMAVGARGLRAALGILLGGVAQQVVEYANWPVLVVRAPYQGLRGILLVTDGSAPSQQAVNFISRFLFPKGAAVSVMHVLPPLLQADLAAQPASYRLFTPDYPPVTLPMDERQVAEQTEIEEQEGQALLDRAVRMLRGAGINATPVLKRGDAATEILEYARSNPIDLIAAGSRGLGAVKGWFLGSVSRKLVHYAGCSVLIVKGGAEASSGKV